MTVSKWGNTPHGHDHRGTGRYEVVGLVVLSQLKVRYGERLCLTLLPLLCWLRHGDVFNGAAPLPHIKRESGSPSCPFVPAYIDEECDYIIATAPVLAVPLPDSGQWYVTAIDINFICKARRLSLVVKSSTNVKWSKIILIYNDYRLNLTQM